MESVVKSSKGKETKRKKKNGKEKQMEKSNEKGSKNRIKFLLKTRAKLVTSH